MMCLLGLVTPSRPPQLVVAAKATEGTDVRFPEFANPAAPKLRRERRYEGEIQEIKRPGVMRQEIAINFSLVACLMTSVGIIIIIIIIIRKLSIQQTAHNTLTAELIKLIN